MLGKYMSLPPDELFASIYRRHGHRCPMSTLGGRLGHAARWHLGEAVPAETLNAVYHITTCALDGIRQSTGCSEVNGNLEVREEGRHLLYLFSSGSNGCGVSVEIRPQILQLTAEYRLIAEEFELELPGMAGKEKVRRTREQEQLLDSLLEHLRTVPESELLMIDSVDSDRAKGI